MNQLKIYRVRPKVVLPKIATEQSACFDLAFQQGEKMDYTVYDRNNEKYSRPLFDYIIIHPGERVLVPTGLIFDIPVGYSVRIYPRSSTALKLGLVVPHSVGIIDADYVEEVVTPLMNVTDIDVIIHVGDRLTQAELVKNEEVELVEVTDRPPRKTSRNGGYGSTGVGMKILNDIAQNPQKELATA